MFLAQVDPARDEFAPARDKFVPARDEFAPARQPEDNEIPDSSNVQTSAAGANLPDPKETNENIGNKALNLGRIIWDHKWDFIKDHYGDHEIMLDHICTRSYRY